jgi:hypothetical protein
VTTTLLELPETVRKFTRRAALAHRRIILASLLPLAMAAPGHALVKKVPIVFGSTQLVPYSPPYIPTQPPTPPGSPVITQRTPFSCLGGLDLIVNDQSGSGFGQANVLFSQPSRASRAVASG